MAPSSANLFPDETTPGNQTGWVIAHCDGGARGNPGPAGYGALLQDETGSVLAELSEFLGNRTNNYAEYSGLLGCLQWALDHGHRRLQVVSDSELMVKQIQGKYKVNSPDLRPLWEEARRRIAQLDRFEISHALRHKNKAADQLANDAMDRGTKRPPRQAQPVATAASSAGGAREAPKQAAPVHSTMLRGFTRGGTIHLLGGAALPDGVFVKIIPE
jgi:ribonuclease HI